jgi:hypothetical protein
MNTPEPQASDPIISTYKPNRYVIFAALIVVVSIGIVVLAFLTSLSANKDGETFPKVYFVIAASILGSLVNQPFRSDENKESRSPSLLILYLAWKCVVAVIFAIIVNLIFISGVVSGELFPQFARTDYNYVSMSKWALDIDPKTNADLAKMLIWSFVAGFSEKLVPNLVTKIFVFPS